MFAGTVNHFAQSVKGPFRSSTCERSPFLTVGWHRLGRWGERDQASSSPRRSAEGETPKAAR